MISRKASHSRPNHSHLNRSQDMTTIMSTQIVSALITSSLRVMMTSWPKLQAPFHKSRMLASNWIMGLTQTQSFRGTWQKVGAYQSVTTSSWMIYQRRETWEIIWATYFREYILFRFPTKYAKRIKERKQVKVTIVALRTRTWLSSKGLRPKRIDYSLTCVSSLWLQMVARHADRN